MSCIFMPAISHPAFSCPVIWSVIFTSCNFTTCTLVCQFHIRQFHVQHFQRPRGIFKCRKIEIRRVVYLLFLTAVARALATSGAQVTLMPGLETWLWKNLGFSSPAWCLIVNDCSIGCYAALHLTVKVLFICRREIFRILCIVVVDSVDHMLPLTVDFATFSIIMAMQYY